MTQTEIIKKPKSWSEPIEAKGMFTFKNIGDSIEGLLTLRDTETSDLFPFYTIKTFEGETKKFHSSKQLEDILSQISLPVYVKITYTDTMKVKNGELHIFEVRTGKN